MLEEKELFLEESCCENELFLELESCAENELFLELFWTPFMEDDILNAGEGEGDEVEIGDSLLPPDAAPITFNNLVIK